MPFDQWVMQHPEVDRYELARLAIEEIPDDVIQVIAEEIDHVRRSAVRAEEHELPRFMRAMATPRPSVAVPVANGDGSVVAATGQQNAPQEFLRLLQRSFKLGDGTRVTWGEATIEQHQQRITMLSAMVRGTQETIRRHREAVARIQTAGAQCLNDLVAVTT